MGKHSNFFKRAQTWVLTVAMLLTVFQPILGFVVVAEDKTPVDITVGELVVKNYDQLTDSEKALIEKSGVLVGDETLTYTKPDADNGDEVISVNTDDKTVTVTVEDGVYFVEGKWLLRAIANTNFGDYESVQYFQRILRDNGVIDKLEEAGVQEDDLVSIYDIEFRFIN